MVNISETTNGNDFELGDFAFTGDATGSGELNVIAAQPQSRSNGTDDPAWIEDFAAHANVF